MAKSVIQQALTAAGVQFKPPTVSHLWAGHTYTTESRISRFYEVLRWSVWGEARANHGMGMKSMVLNSTAQVFHSILPYIRDFHGE